MPNFRLFFRLFDQYFYSSLAKCDRQTLVEDNTGSADVTPMVFTFTQHNIVCRRVHSGRIETQSSDVTELLCRHLQNIVSQNEPGTYSCNMNQYYYDECNKRMHLPHYSAITCSINLIPRMNNLKWLLEFPHTYDEEHLLLPSIVITVLSHSIVERLIHLFTVVPFFSLLFRFLPTPMHTQTIIPMLMPILDHIKTKNHACVRFFVFFFFHSVDQFQYPNRNFIY